jgi:hypothetical protein
MDPLKPSIQILIALGSLVVHYEEWTSPNGHAMDKNTIDSIRNQPDVKEWFEQMRKLTFLPLKRNN